MTEQIIAGLLSSILGGLLVATVNHLFTRRKTNAEAEKFKAEAEKIRAEAEKVRVETTKLVSEVEKLSISVDEASYYRSSNSREKIVFELRPDTDSFDIEGWLTCSSTDPERKTGKGSVSFKQGTIIIDKPDIIGGYKLHIRKYIIDGKSKEIIPANVLLSEKRKFKITCEGKTTQGSIKLRFAFADKTTLDSKDIEFIADQWQNIELYFKIPPTANSFLAIDLFQMSEPTSVLLRNIKIIERLD